MLKLNLGCEDKILKGFVNVDMTKRKGVKTHNLNKIPLPWKTSSVDYILCSHLLEHLDNPLNFLKELHRISKKDSVIDLYVPHFSGFATYADFTHKFPGFSFFSLGEEWVNKDLFKLFSVKKKLNFTRVNYKWMNEFFNPLINLSPTIYERFLCYLIPCSEIHFQLKVLK